MAVLIILFLALMSSVAAAAEECHPSQTECHFWLVVEDLLTMVYDRRPVYGYEGKLYLKGESPSNFTTHVPISDVITADGVMRLAIAINRTIPGPELVVYEGQILNVHVTSKLQSETFTIHWHGQQQKGTIFMDGVPYITQCPIGPGQIFTYRFKAAPKGSYWYHSHVGVVRLDGLYGALIIKDRSQVQVKDYSLLVSEWHHPTATQIFETTVQLSDSPDGSIYLTDEWTSAVINGKGQYRDKDTGVPLQVPLTSYNVSQGEEIRFRIMAVGFVLPFRVSVDGHRLSMVSADGHNVVEQQVESVIVNPGERFDVVITADNDVDNYWIRAETVEVEKVNHSAMAILHYAGAEPTTRMPSTQRQVCTADDPCLVVNCHFLYYPSDSHKLCITLNDIKSADPKPTPIFTPGHSLEYFFKVGFPGRAGSPPSINGHRFLTPSVSPITKEQLWEYDCDRKDCGEDKVCQCFYHVTIPYGRTVQMTLLNIGSGTIMSHPMHIHGHHFYVLKTGYPKYNRTTGEFITANTDIDCRGDRRLDYCNNATWADRSWLHGNIPGLNLLNPPRKDTVMVPIGGYVVVRIVSDNPGQWLMHCHTYNHLPFGMGMMLNIAPDRQPKTPPGFPVCQHFYGDEERDVQHVKETITGTSPTSTSSGSGWTSTFFGVFTSLFSNAQMVYGSMFAKEAILSDEANESKKQFMKLG